MRPGSHASGDGSFGRSAGTHAGKAIVLVAIAVLIGVFLLRRNGTPPVTVAVVPTTTTTTTTAVSPTTTPAASGPTSSTVAVRTPANVKVLVANGSSVAGLATRTSTKLHSAGYDTLASTNATVKALATVVYYAPSFQPEALVVARQLGVQVSAVKPLPAQGQVPVANLNGADVLVVAGPDLAGSTASSGGTTATTRAGVTSTTKATTTTTTKA